MKKPSASRSALGNLRFSFGSLFSVSLALLTLSISSSPSAVAAASQKVTVVQSYHNDVSPPLRNQEPWPLQVRQEREAAENPPISVPHVDKADSVVQSSKLLHQLAPSIPAPILNFAGIPYPGVGCFCLPPDTNGEVGATQYVQMVNEAYQVFDKATGTSLLGPNSIESVWSGFGGACQTGGFGDPVVMYDQIANRWVITEFASPTGGTPITDECVAVSTSSDATGTWNRYGFHLGSNFFDYPHLGVWPDAYYMSMNVFNSTGTAYLGVQPFAFDRAKMLAGQPATFVTTGIVTGGSGNPPMLPSDLDGSTLPPSGAPNSYVMYPASGAYKVFHFSVGTPFGTSPSFTLFSSPAAASFSQLCPGNRSCVPQAGTTVRIDGIGDRLMYRLGYRNFGDHESVVGNFTVSVSGVAGIRWFELRNVTAGPVTKFQEATFSPDSTYRWMGSVAMDGQGNMGLGYSASSSSIFPQIRYTGRLATDPINTLQTEVHLFDGTGSQTSSSDRWGDYSDMTVDPVDDQTFWYTQEYYDTTTSVGWRTRIGSFKLATGGGGANLVSAASKLTHGSAGTFSIDMPLSGPSGVEDRVASTYNAVFTFDTAVTSGQVQIVSGTATAGTPTFSGNTMTVPLTGVSNEQIVTIRVKNINGGGGQTDVPFGFLIADVTANRTVDKPDFNSIVAANGQPVSSANFRNDVDANGSIKKKQDGNQVKTHKGESIP
jgi:hypothetical protein